MGGVYCPAGGGPVGAMYWGLAPPGAGVVPGVPDMGAACDPGVVGGGYCPGAEGGGNCPGGGAYCPGGG